MSGPRPALLAFGLVVESLVGAWSAQAEPPFHANYNFYGESVVVRYTSSENFDLAITPNLARATLSALVPTRRGQTLKIDLTWTATEPFTTMPFPSRPELWRGFFYISHALF